MKLMNLVNKLSMEEKTQLSCHMASKVSYNDFFTDTRVLSDEDYDPVFIIVDFGYSHVYKVMEGRCSLQATLDFDIGEAENKIESDIIHMSDLLEKYHITINYDSIYSQIKEFRKEKIDETAEKIKG